jgi:hypothetical protein
MIPRSPRRQSRHVMPEAAARSGVHPVGTVADKGPFCRISWHSWRSEHPVRGAKLDFESRSLSQQRQYVGNSALTDPGTRI